MRIIRLNLIFIGILLGAGLGLLAGWVLLPREDVHASPVTLRADYQEIYMLMVAAAYRDDGDIERASTRLAALGLNDTVAAVTALAQRASFQNRNEFTVSTVSDLALSLGGRPQSPTPSHKAAGLRTLTPTPGKSVTPDETDTLITTIPSLPTPQASQTHVYDYVLVDQETVCNADLTAPLIQVKVMDRNNNPLEGVQVQITWTGGQDGFSTGLKPEISQGYGDFAMQQGQVYSVQVGSRTIPLRGIVSENCTSGNSSYPGSVLIEWQREG